MGGTRLRTNPSSRWRRHRRARLLARRATAASSASATPVLRLDRHATAEPTDRRHHDRPDGNGYRIVARDGGIFSFGSAPFFGERGRTTRPVSTDVIGVAPSPTNLGYWIRARTAPSTTSAGRRPTCPTSALRATTSVAAISSNPNAQGYALVLRMAPSIQLRSRARRIRRGSAHTTRGDPGGHVPQPRRRTFVHIGAYEDDEPRGRVERRP